MFIQIEGVPWLRTARRTLAGFEAMAMIRKGRIRCIGGGGIKAQSDFAAGLFQIAAMLMNHQAGVDPETECNRTEFEYV